MSLIEQYSRISHHTITNTGSFSIPSSEDFTDGSWNANDLALSEIGVNESEGKAYMRISSSIVEITGGGGGGVSDGDYGDVTVSSGGTVWDINASTVGTTELSATGTADSTTFLRGDNTWAAPTAPDPEGWTTIVKSANQDVVNSNVFTDDTELTFDVVAGGHYMVEMTLCWSSNNATTDYKMAFAIIAPARMRGYGMCTSSDITTNKVLATSGAGSSLSNTSFAAVSGNIDFMMNASMNFNFSVDSDTTFKFQQANVGLAIGGTSRTWKGSILKYKRID